MDALTAEATIGVWVGFFFILTKTLIRFVCRRLVRRKFSRSEHAAWFGVDMSVLSIVTWVNHDIPTLCEFRRDATVLASLVLGLLLLGCCTVYAAYVYGEKKQRARWQRVWVGLMIVLSTFIGLAVFIATVGFLSRGFDGSGPRVP